jgi:hypothetical protein
MKFGLLVMAFFIFSAFLINISFAQNFNVGVSPGSIDLGYVEKGSTKLVDFYIITPSEETLLVKLEPERVLDSSFVNSNSSEEDVIKWINIINNPVELKPNNETLQTLGGLIKGQRQVSFLIEIPENAEPGEHIVSIKPVPSAYSEATSPVGSVIVAITSIKIFFDVIGDAVRNGVILDVQVGNYNGNQLELNTYFQNTGTVTLYVDGNQKIYDKDGNLVKELNLEKMFVKPKEIKTFKTFMPVDEINLEDYDVYTVIDYKTGEAEKISSIKIAPATALLVSSESSPVMLIVIILIIFIATIVVYRKIQ